MSQEDPIPIIQRLPCTYQRWRLPVLSTSSFTRCQTISTDAIIEVSPHSCKQGGNRNLPFAVVDQISIEDFKFRLNAICPSKFNEPRHFRRVCCFCYAWRVRMRIVCAALCPNEDEWERTGNVGLKREEKNNALRRKMSRSNLFDREETILGNEGQRETIKVQRSPLVCNRIAVSRTSDVENANETPTKTRLLFPSGEWSIARKRGCVPLGEPRQETLHGGYLALKEIEKKLYEKITYGQATSKTCVNSIHGLEKGPTKRMARVTSLCDSERSRARMRSVGSPEHYLYR